MKRYISVFKMMIAIVLASSLFMGCSDNKELKPLKFGINPWPGYEFVYLAKVKGFYAKAGLDIEIVQFSSLNDNRRAFERNQIDGMGSTLIEMIQAAEYSNRQPKAVYVPDYSNGGDLIIASNGVNSVNDLKGKSIAIEPGTLNLFLLNRAIQLSQINISDVNIVKMPQTAMQQALLEGKVQAIVTYPPVSIDALKEKSHKAIFTSKEIPGEVIDVLVFDSSVISSRQDDIRKFILAYNEAVEFSSSNPAEAYQIMAEREGISAQDFETAVSQDLLILSFQQQAKIFEANGTLYKAINEVQNVLFENSEISTKRAAASFIDDSFVYKQ